MTISTRRDASSNQPPLELRFLPPRPRRSRHVSVAPIHIIIPFLSHLLHKISQGDVRMHAVRPFDRVSLPRVWVDIWFSTFFPTGLKIRNPGRVGEAGSHFLVVLRRYLEQKISVDIDCWSTQVHTLEHFIIQITTRVFIIVVGYNASVVHLIRTVRSRIQGDLEDASAEGEPELVVRCFIK